MKEVIVAIFTYWENGKNNDKFVVRMSTEEEQELTDKLAYVFGIEGKDGLLETKWAIREKFKKTSKAPLWALKYVGNNKEKYCEFINQLFKFSKSTDENIVQSFIVELLNGIKIYDVDIANAVATVENSTCLDNYILQKLADINEEENALEEVKEFLNKRMSGEIVFWEEKDVESQILRWKILKPTFNEESKSSDTNELNNSQESYKTSKEKLEGFKRQDNYEGNKVVDSTTIKDAVKIIEENKDNSEKLYKILMKIIKKYEFIANDINELL